MFLNLPVGLEVLGGEGGHDSRVRPARAVLGVAHTVRAEPAPLVDARHDAAAGTHAERVGRRNGLALQVVRRRPEPRRSRPLAVAPPGHELLRVLDANTQLERLRLQLDAAGHELLPGVPRRVTDRQHERVQTKLALARTNGPEPPTRRAVDRIETDHPGAVLEPDAAGLEASAEAGEHPVQAVGTDVGPSVEGDLRRRACSHELLEDGGLQPITGSRVQLAVRIGPRAPVTEEEVGLGIGGLNGTCTFEGKLPSTSAATLTSAMPAPH